MTKFCEEASPTLTATSAVHAREPHETLRRTLMWNLFYVFKQAGYEPSECTRLVNLAIGPVSQALEVSEQAYKLHLKAVLSIARLNPLSSDIPVQPGGVNSHTYHYTEEKKS